MKEVGMGQGVGPVLWCMGERLCLLSIGEDS